MALVVFCCHEVDRPLVPDQSLGRRRDQILQTALCRKNGHISGYGPGFKDADAGPPPRQQAVTIEEDRYARPGCRV